MGFELDTVRGVFSFYDRRTTDELTIGKIKTEGVLNQLTIELSGENLNDIENSIALRQITDLPAGSTPIEVHVDVSEAFVLAGTTPNLEIGTEGSEETNGFQILEATLEAIGSVTITSFNGTWAARLAAVTPVGIALSGTGPTATTAGKARIVVSYFKP